MGVPAGPPCTEYGAQAPVLIGIHHGMRARRAQLTRTTAFWVLILHLDGAVRRHLARDDHLEWGWRKGGGE